MIVWIPEGAKGKNGMFYRGGAKALKKSIRDEVAFTVEGDDKNTIAAEIRNKLKQIELER